MWPLHPFQVFPVISDDCERTPDGRLPIQIIRYPRDAIIFTQAQWVAFDCSLIFTHTSYRIQS